ncbi:hypothetical protein BDV95DRAFT_586008 [Massariosphaeria phaeospora]|uniref:Uncharacterized protein n=1 Tax=Massariosphaeria phaeospora TaxID=100035 RepID=A0A7C8M2N8_9PLEO|nr:hypothetical protein BDV95DRAFT_586008 [Massariosphaeria phaeospora]
MRKSLSCLTHESLRLTQVRAEYKGQVLPRSNLQFPDSHHSKQSIRIYCSSYHIYQPGVPTHTHSATKFHSTLYNPAKSTGQEPHHQLSTFTLSMSSTTNIKSDIYDRIKSLESSSRKSTHFSPMTGRLITLRDQMDKASTRTSKLHYGPQILFKEILRGLGKLFPMSADKKLKRQEEMHTSSLTTTSDGEESMPDPHAGKPSASTSESVVETQVSERSMNEESQCPTPLAGSLPESRLESLRDKIDTRVLCVRNNLDTLVREFETASKTKWRYWFQEPELGVLRGIHKRFSSLIDSMMNDIYNFRDWPEFKQYLGAYGSTPKQLALSIEEALVAERAVTGLGSLFRVQGKGDFCHNVYDGRGLDWYQFKVPS